STSALDASSRLVRGSNYELDGGTNVYEHILGTQCSFFYYICLFLHESKIVEFFSSSLCRKSCENARESGINHLWHDLYKHNLSTI
ncbi:MAG TPA: hypothetical protein VFU05_05620, partial [Cyclobacteriaceae bacterium]|nr:hypothetical protein [Cyclobacteriaceae bacterium]